MIERQNDMILKDIAKELVWTGRKMLMIIKGYGFKSIGRHSYVKKPIRIFNGHNVTIGNYVNVLDGLRLETIEKWNDQVFNPNVVIGDRVSFGQCVHLVCASKVIIHDDVAIGPFSMINDCTHGYSDPTVPLSIQNLKTAPIEIGEGTIIGMSVCILPGVSIGKHCYIGANTVVTKNLPDYTVVSAVQPRKATIPFFDN